MGLCKPSKISRLSVWCWVGIIPDKGEKNSWRAALRRRTWERTHWMGSGQPGLVGGTQPIAEVGLRGLWVPQPNCSVIQWLCDLKVPSNPNPTQPFSMIFKDPPNPVHSMGLQSFRTLPTQTQPTPFRDSVAHSSPAARSKASTAGVCIVEPGQKAVETLTKVPGDEKTNNFQTRPPSVCCFFWGLFWPSFLVIFHFAQNSNVWAERSDERFTPAWGGGVQKRKKIYIY